MVSQRLRMLREEKKLTQDDVAKLLNISRSTVSKYESGFLDPSTEVLTEFANIYAVSTDYLLGVSDIRNPYEPETIAAHKEGAEWTEEELAAIEAFKAMVRSHKRKGK